MEGLRKRSRRMAPLGATVAAMAVALVGAAGAVPAVASTGARAVRALPANVTWHKIKLINGWTSEQAQDGTGAPAWAIQDGIVYLSGSIQQSMGTPGTFAVLPKAARPAHDQYIGVDTASGSYSELFIETNGDMLVSSGLPENPTTFTSLAGASFLAQHTTPSNLHLKAGWQAGPSSDHAGAPSYKLIDDVVHLSGEITHASGTNEIAFVLPKRDRPAKWLYMVTMTADGIAGVVEVAPDGDVRLFNGDFSSSGTLDGISFSVARPGWHSISLKNGWISLQSADHTGTPSYRVSKGVVYLAGAVREGTSATSVIFAVLPHSARPVHNVYIPTYNINGIVGNLYIDASNGQVRGNGYGSSAAVFTSLAGISFPLGS